MRCEELTNWSAVRHFLRSDAEPAQVTLNAPSAQDVADWGCSATAFELQVVRDMSSTDRLWVLATKLDADFPSECFGNLSNARWKIEDRFNRLKHRYQLEAVSGLSQQALIIGRSSKVLADNLS